MRFKSLRREQLCTDRRTLLPHKSMRPTDSFLRVAPTQRPTTDVPMLRAKHDIWKPCHYFLSLVRVRGHHQPRRSPDTRRSSARKRRQRTIVPPQQQIQDTISPPNHSMPGQGQDIRTSILRSRQLAAGGGCDFGGPDVGTAADFGAPADSVSGGGFVPPKPGGIVLPKQCA